jgi:phosphatidylserine synthase
MNKIKDLLYKVSAIAILVAAVLFAFEPEIAPWVMAFAVAVFTIITMMTPYPGKSIRGKRLFLFQIFACVLMAAATYLMFNNQPEWAVLMIISAIFIFYSSVVLPKVLQKEKEDQK